MSGRGRGAGSSAGLDGGGSSAWLYSLHNTRRQHVAAAATAAQHAAAAATAAQHAAVAAAQRQTTGLGAAAHGEDAGRRRKKTRVE